MADLLHIIPFPEKIKREDFKRFFVDTTKEAFYKKKGEMVPMAFLLIHKNVLAVFPNFQDDQHKSMSMQQMKQLAKTSGAEAYGMVSEIYYKAVRDAKNSEEEINFISDLNYQVSLLPDRVECLMVYIEIKSKGSVDRSTHFWEISTDEKGRRSLKNFREMEAEFEGRMTHVL